MSYLNSVLIEGCLTAKPVFSMMENDVAMCDFVLSTDYRHCTPDGWRYMDMTLPIKCWQRLAEAVRDHGDAGRKARVVGRITHEPEKGLMYITAEHVEFRRDRQKAHVEEAVAA
jgi:single-stranded DNA-binding protein